MGQVRFVRSGFAALNVAVLLAVSACGGGGDSAVPRGDVKPVVQPTQSVQSVVQPHTAGAAAVQVSAPGAPVALGVMSGLAGAWLPPEDANQHGDPAVIMPLAQAHWRNVARAAQGTLLTKANSLASPSAMAAFLQAPLGSLDRQVWGQSGHLFNNSFLSDLGLVSAASAVNGYTAAPLDFAQSQELASADFAASINGTIGQSGWASFAPKASTRLVQFDHGVWAWPIQGGQATQALVADDRGRLYKTASLVWRDQVRAVTGADYAARVVGQGAGRVLYIMPNDGSLSAWSVARLSQVVDEVVAGASSEAATDGELILPIQTHTLRLDLTAVVKGLERAFDPLLADLRGLDLQGGTYLKALGDYASLDITADGLKVEAQAGLAFVHDPRNPYQNTSTSSNYFGNSLGLGQAALDFLTLPACGDVPRVKAGFLVLLDANGQLMVLTAFKPMATGSRCR